MIILGLTGSIGMGKSTASRMLRRMGVPVHDADAAVHHLLEREGVAKEAVAAAFPEAVVGGRIDRARLGQRVFGDLPALARLEAILHPHVRQDAERFLLSAARNRTHLVGLDFPLLLETRGAARCDLVIVVTAPHFVQAARVLGRPGMTKERLKWVRARQLPETEKRRLADFVIRTGLTRRFTWDRLRHIVRQVRGRRPDAWRPRRRRE